MAGERGDISSCGCLFFSCVLLWRKVLLSSLLLQLLSMSVASVLHILTVLFVLCCCDITGYEESVSQANNHGGSIEKGSGKHLNLGMSVCFM